MSLNDNWNLAQQATFVQKVQAAIIHTAIAVQNEVAVDQQTIHMNATGGTFTLTFGGNTTPAQQWNSSAPAIQTALNALASIGAGGVECTGGPLGTADVVVNFIGSALIGAQPVLTHADASLTGGTPTATVTHTTTGVWVLNHAKRSALASKVLANPTGYAALFAYGAADNATLNGTDYPPPNYTLAGGVTQATADTDLQNQINSIFTNYA
jgi:hypothetical protein